jgi:hypothetical protein
MITTLVAKQTNDGIPVLYMPCSSSSFFARMQRSQSRFDEADFDFPLELLLRNIYINYDKKERILCSTKKTSEFNRIGYEIITVSVYFFDKICSYLDLYEIVKSLRSENPTNAFTLYFFLEYANYKKDIRLINLLLKKICKITVFDVSMVFDTVKRMFDERLPIKLPKYHAENLIRQHILPTRFRFDNFFIYEKITDNDTIKYLCKCIKKLTEQSCINILFHDELKLMIGLHKKIKKVINPLHYALRFGSNKILKYLYTLEKPIKEYIDPVFLNENEIDGESRDILETILETRDLTFIRDMYEHTTDLEYLNNRICLFIPVRKNDYATTLFLLSKGVKTDKISPIFAGYNGSIDILKLFGKYNDKYGIKFEEMAVYYAAYAGQFDLLKEMYKNGYKFESSLIEYMLESGKLDLNNRKTLDKVYEPLQDHILSYACRKESTNLETIEYLYYKGAKLEPWVMNSIASSGSLDVFRFFMSKGIKIDQHVLGNLATRGQSSIIRSLYNNVVPVISFTGKLGDNTVTRFFGRDRKELNYATVRKGIEYGCFEVKQSFTITRTNQMLLTDLYAPGTDTQAILDNFGPSSIDATVYNQLPPVDEGTIQTTARHRHIDLLEFLISKRVPIDDDAMYDSIVRGFTDVTVMLYNYYPVVNDNHITLAKLWNRHEILKFFADKPIGKPKTTIDFGYDIKPFDYYDQGIQRILYYACSHGEMDIIKSYRGSYSIKLKPTVVIWNAGRYSHEHTDMFYVAILHGQFEVLQYLESVSPIDYKADSKYVACAVRIGRIDFVKYLVKRGYAVCENSMRNAIEKCRIDMVKYLIHTNAPIPIDALKIAKKYNADEIHDLLI